MEIIANDDGDFNKFKEFVEDDGALDFEDWDEEPPGFDDEPVPEPDFDFYDFCNLKHRCQVPMRLGMERKSGSLASALAG